MQLAGGPEVYAEGLLKACRFCAESPLICVSGITGSDRKILIVRIMTRALVQKMDLSKKLLLGGVAFVSLAIPVALGLSAKLDASTAVNVQSADPFENLATTNKDTAVDLAPLRLPSPQSGKLRLATTMRYCLTNFSDVGVTFRSVAMACIVRQAFSPAGGFTY